MDTKLSESEQRFVDVYTAFIWAVISPLSTFALINVELYVWVEFSHFLNWFLLTLFLIGIVVTVVSLVKQILYLIRFDFKELWYVLFTPFSKVV